MLNITKYHNAYMLQKAGTYTHAQARNGHGGYVENVVSTEPVNFPNILWVFGFLSKANWAISIV